MDLSKKIYSGKVEFVQKCAVINSFDTYFMERDINDFLTETNPFSVNLINTTLCGRDYITTIIYSEKITKEK